MHVQFKVRLVNRGYQPITLKPLEANATIIIPTKQEVTFSADTQKSIRLEGNSEKFLRFSCKPNLLLTSSESNQFSKFINDGRINKIFDSLKVTFFSSDGTHFNSNEFISDTVFYVGSKSTPYISIYFYAGAIKVIDEDFTKRGEMKPHDAAPFGWVSDPNFSRLNIEPEDEQKIEWLVE
jgi:hypothetical protein